MRASPQRVFRAAKAVVTKTTAARDLADALSWQSPVAQVCPVRKLETRASPTHDRVAGSVSGAGNDKSLVHEPAKHSSLDAKMDANSTQSKNRFCRLTANYVHIL